MGEAVFYVFEVGIREGQLDNLKAVMNDMSDATKANEPGTIDYQWFVSPDETTCHVFERYASSNALLAHLKYVKEHFSERLWSTIEAKHLTVYGAPDDEMRKTLGALGAVFMGPIGGFSR